MKTLLAFVLGLLVGMFLATGLASAHGDAAWINKMHLGCCGPTDCHKAKDGDWVREGTGYRNTHTAEFVEDAAAKASVDGSFWECRYGSGNEQPGEETNGRLRAVIAAEGGMCLFVPSIGM